jgi:glutamyl-tRNA reductase
MQESLAVISKPKTEADERIFLIDRLHMAGVNHKTAPVSVREKAVLPKSHGETLIKLKERLGLTEVVALSTCNRTEFYWTASEEVSPLEFFKEIAKLDSDDLKNLAPSVYFGKGAEVADHLFRVACGLDSLVQGETQILNQVKKAYERSRQRGLTSTALNLLFQKTFEVTKKVHNCTRLSSHRASIPTVALKFAEAIFDDLSKTFVLVVGTGEIARLTLDAIRKRGARNIAFITRTAERAKVWEDTHKGAEVKTLDKISGLLWRADIVVSCTHADEPVIEEHMIKEALARRSSRSRPLLLLDLGIPRNIAPEVERLEQVYLHNVDDLQEVVEKNRLHLEEEVNKAQTILDEALESYCKDCLGATAGATISELRSLAQGIAEKELERTMKKIPDLSPKEQQELATLVHRILGKVLHPASENLRIASRNGRGEEAIAWARKLFGLDTVDISSKSKRDFK